MTIELWQLGLAILAAFAFGLLVGVVLSACCFVSRGPDSRQGTEDS